VCEWLWQQPQEFYTAGFQGLVKRRDKYLNLYEDYAEKINVVCMSLIGFGGLEVACWPLVPKFAGSNLANAVGFLRVKKSSARLPSEGK